MTIPALKLGGSAPSSGPFRLAVCVLGMGRKFYVDIVLGRVRGYNAVPRLVVLVLSSLVGALPALVVLVSRL